MVCLHWNVLNDFESYFVVKLMKRKNVSLLGSYDIIMSLSWNVYWFNVIYNQQMYIFRTDNLLLQCNQQISLFFNICTHYQMNKTKENHQKHKMQRKKNCLWQWFTWVCGYEFFSISLLFSFFFRNHYSESSLFFNRIIWLLTTWICIVLCLTFFSVSFFVLFCYSQ